MEFKHWLAEGENKRAKIIAHIAGASGSGKSTLIEKLVKKHKDILCRDLDDFEDAAKTLLGWKDKTQQEITSHMRRLIAIKKQSLLDDFLDHADRPVVLAGHHKDPSGEYALIFSTAHKFYLDVPAETCASRAIRRDDKKSKALGKKVKTRSKENMERSVSRKAKKNQDLLVSLRRAGYYPIDEEGAMKWIAKNKTGFRS